MGVSQSPDQWVEAHLGPIAEALSSIVFYTVPIAGTDVPLIVMWTAVAGLFFTFYLRLINVRALGLAMELELVLELVQQQVPVGLELVPERGLEQALVVLEEQHPS